jgi:malate synthase
MFIQDQDKYPTVLTNEAVEFVVGLVRKFAPTIRDLLETRQKQQYLFDMGEKPHFLLDTIDIRQSDWRVAPLPRDLWDRRVEITGPTDRKMIINALNSGAKVFMADFEDSNSPTWDNLMQGQINLMDAVRSTITYASETKEYKLNEKTAVLMVRPRGLHLPEKHFQVDGQPIPGALLDFGLYFFHNARQLILKGSAPYFYLPKLENHLEARLWNDIFVYAQQQFDLPIKTIRATCLIETITAAFEMDEILWELKDHSAGLNCGRWDYIFSFIKKFAEDPKCVLPDRSQLTMDQGFLVAYSRLLINTCHRRAAQAMGGMSALIPIKNDPEANQAAMQKVYADKLREATLGHDGAWVAHPGLVSIVRSIYDAYMPYPNQIANQPNYQVSEADLLNVPWGSCTEEGLRHNVRVGIQYLAAWLRGNGCVPLYNLMEDAATAEISRAQVWQWIRHKVEVGGSVLTTERFLGIAEQEMKQLGGGFDDAYQLFVDLSLAPTFQDFLTLPAYELLP